jgi:multidrug resistance efflux pump
MEALDPQPSAADVAPQGAVAAKAGHPSEAERILQRIDRKHHLFMAKRRVVAAKRRRIVQRILPWTRRLTTLSALAVATVTASVTWSYYVVAPWTRDGRLRVQVASVAPEVAGRIIELRVADNQFVHKGDVLYVIDPFDFKVALLSNKASLQQKAADLQVKQLQSGRR